MVRPRTRRNRFPPFAFAEVQGLIGHNTINCECGALGEIDLFVVDPRAEAQHSVFGRKGGHSPWKRSCVGMELRSKTDDLVNPIAAGEKELHLLDLTGHPLPSHRHDVSRPKRPGRRHRDTRLRRDRDTRHYQKSEK